MILTSYDVLNFVLKNREVEIMDYTNVLSLRVWWRRAS